MDRTRSCLATHTSSPLHLCVLHFLSPYRILDFTFGHLPFPRIGMITLLALSEKPPPHATEQGDHCDHFLSLQLRSQEPVLHGRDSAAVLHAVPPFFGCTNTLRVRPWAPPSQSLEHFDHPDHFEPAPQPAPKPSTAPAPDPAPTP